jgi:hypothetical protein
MSERMTVKLRRPDSKFIYDTNVRLEIIMKKSMLNKLDKVRKTLSRKQAINQIFKWALEDSTP